MRKNQGSGALYSRDASSISAGKSRVYTLGKRLDAEKKQYNSFTGRTIV
jgi:hypothetical protein